MLDDPKTRYRIEILTDRQLRWFAQISEIMEDGREGTTGWTPSRETCAEVVQEIGKWLDNRRRGQ